MNHIVVLQWNELRIMICCIVHLLMLWCFKNTFNTWLYFIVERTRTLKYFGEKGHCLSETTRRIQWNIITNFLARLHKYNDASQLTHHNSRLYFCSIIISYLKAVFLFGWALQGHHGLLVDWFSIVIRILVVCRTSVEYVIFHVVR